MPANISVKADFDSSEAPQREDPLLREADWEPKTPFHTARNRLDEIVRLLNEASATIMKMELSDQDKIELCHFVSCCSFYKKSLSELYASESDMGKRLDTLSVISTVGESLLKSCQTQGFFAKCALDKAGMRKLCSSFEDLWEGEYIRHTLKGFFLPDKEPDNKLVRLSSRKSMLSPNVYRLVEGMSLSREMSSETLTKNTERR